MTTFRDENDVLTLLIHLGYLAYDSTEHCVYIPNNEIRNEYANAVSVSDWGEVSKALKNSADVLNAIWNQNEQMVAQGMQRAHYETSHLQYNDENALSYLFHWLCMRLETIIAYIVNCQQERDLRIWSLFREKNFLINLLW